MILDMEKLTGTHILILAGVALVVALVAAAVWPRRWQVVALVVGLLFPAYTLSGALLGIWRNPKSNTMWPFGVAFACLVTLVPAYFGAGVGEMVRRALARRRTAATDPAVPAE